MAIIGNFWKIFPGKYICVGKTAPLLLLTSASQMVRKSIIVRKLWRELPNFQLNEHNTKYCFQTYNHT